MKKSIWSVFVFVGFSLLAGTSNADGLLDAIGGGQLSGAPTYTVDDCGAGTIGASLGLCQKRLALAEKILVEKGFTILKVDACGTIELPQSYRCQDQSEVIYNAGRIQFAR